MDNFELTFRFDDIEQTMTRHNGLPIGKLAKLLAALSKALSTEDSPIVLSEIKGNCYAPVFSTKSKTQYERVRTLHTEISENNFSTLTQKEKNYAYVLKNILSGGIILNVYDESKEYYKTIEKIEDTNIFKYYYSTNSIRGFLTKIGSRNLASKNTIFIDSFPIEIEINEQQDAMLKNHYKDSFIEFYITEKKNKENDKVENVVLDDFKIIEKSDSFYKNILELREKHGPYFTHLKDREDE